MERIGSLLGKVPNGDPCVLNQSPSNRRKHLADYTVSQVVERYVASTAPTPASPDMFRFAESGALLAVLLTAGATATSERLLQFSIRASMSVEDFWTRRSEMSEKLRTKLALLSKPQLVELKREITEAIRGYSSESGMNFPAKVLIVSGAKGPS